MEKMISLAELTKALRCSANPNNSIDNCANCPYMFREEVKKDFPVRPDEVVDGIGYWISCDCDQMVLDAADVIEQLSSAITTEQSNEDTDDRR